VRQWWLVLSLVLPSGVAWGNVTEVSGDEARQLLGTVEAGLRARCLNTPALTVAGVWRGFYTQVHWDIWRDITKYPKDFESMVKGDRAAVALALWESADGEEWEAEFQGVYRGPNSWVYPKRPGDPRAVSDLYRREHATRDRLVVLDLCMQEHPCVYATTPPRHPGRSYVDTYLGLADDRGPFPESLELYLGELHWRLGPIRRDGDRLRVSLGSWDEAEKSAGELLLEVDTAKSFAPMWFRQVWVTSAGKGNATEIQWSDYRNLGGGAPTVAGKAIQWEFNYCGPPGHGWLESTEVVDWLQLARTAPSSPRPSLPRCADLEEGLCGPVDTVDLRQCWGEPIWVATRNFGTETAPEPPADLAGLDARVMAAQIRHAYGFE